jgi:hypothetical protein
MNRRRVRRVVGWLSSTNLHNFTLSSIVHIHHSFILSHHPHTCTRIHTLSPPTHLHPHSYSLATRTPAPAFILSRHPHTCTRTRSNVTEAKSHTVRGLFVVAHPCDLLNSNLFPRLAVQRRAHQPVRSASDQSDWLVPTREEEER